MGGAVRWVGQYHVGGVVSGGRGSQVGGAVSCGRGSIRWEGEYQVGGAVLGGWGSIRWVGFYVLSSMYHAVPLELCSCMQCRMLSLSFTEELATETSEKVFIFLASVQQVLHVHVLYL